MAYHLYAGPGGTPKISERVLDPEMFREWQYLGEFKEKPDVVHKWYVDGKWVRAGDPEYVDQRKAAYPRLYEQLDALWHAMDKGILPKVPGFYDRIKAVKDRFPKP